ncbi:Purine permease, partial [Parasponia andersonii]
DDTSNTNSNTGGSSKPLFNLKTQSQYCRLDAPFKVKDQSCSSTFNFNHLPAAVILGRFYYDQGGNSKWMATLVQNAAFPLLLIPLFLISSSQYPLTSSTAPSIKVLASIYFFLGVFVAGDNSLYSVGLLHLSASTYSLICANQLVVTAIFSYFINSQKLTALILNSVVVLSLSAVLIAVNDDSDWPTGITRSKYIVGFICTLTASALYALLLSLKRLSFQKVIKQETFSVVLEMQIYISLVATCTSIIGLFTSGEWRTLHGEMQGFGKGGFAYVMTLIWTAVAWLALFLWLSLQLLQ